MTTKASTAEGHRRESRRVEARLAELRAHVARLHAGGLSAEATSTAAVPIDDDELDRRIGLRPDLAEPAVTIGDLILAHGHHRMEKGDLPYRVIRELFRRLPPATDLAEPLVDLGCGYGRIGFYGRLLFGSAFRFWGVEILPERVAEARRVRDALGLDGLHFERGDAVRVPWPESGRYCLMNPDLPMSVPPLLARLEAVARRRPIVVASVATTNLHLAEQPWLRELGPTPKYRLDLRFFASAP